MILVLEMVISNLVASRIVFLGSEPWRFCDQGVSFLFARIGADSGCIELIYPDLCTNSLLHEIRGVKRGEHLRLGRSWLVSSRSAFNIYQDRVCFRLV